MTTAYTSLLGLALPVTGELSGTWGDTVNTAITSLLDTAVAGTTSITTDADVTLTTTTGASNQARQAIILWNPASGTTTRNITAPAQSKIYTVINASGGTQSIVIRGAGPTTGVTIAKGESATVAWNGSDFVKVGSSGGAITFTDLTVTGNTILGDAAADTLTVNATSTFAAPVSFQGLVRLPSTGRSAAAALTVTAPAFLYGVASTYTDTTSSGTIAAMAPFYSIAQPTLSTSNVTTYTNAATLYIANAPAAGGSATITNPYSLWINAGTAFLNGPVILGNTLAVNGAADFNNTTDSTSVTTGAVVIDGGVGIAKSLFVGGNITVTKNTSNSTIRLQSLAPYSFPGDYTIQAGGQSTPALTIIDNTSTLERLTFLSDVTVFNENSGDIDFRIESDGNANMFFVDAANNRIGIQTNAPQTQFNFGSAQDNFMRFDDSRTAVSGLFDSYMSWHTYSATNAAAQIGISHNDYTSLNRRFYIKYSSEGANAVQTRLEMVNLETVFNQDSLDVDFRVESDTNTHALFVDAGNSTVLIGTSTTSANGVLQVNGGIGIAANSTVRQSTNGDGAGFLKFFGTQFVAGNLNSDSYNYADGGYLASVTAGDSAILFDAGRLVNTDGRVRVVNTTSGNVQLRVGKGSSYALLADTNNNRVGINNGSPTQALDVTGNILASASVISSADLYIGSTANTMIPTLERGVYLNGTTNNAVIGYGMYINDGGNNRRGSMFLDDSAGIWGWDVTASSGVPYYQWRRAGGEIVRFGDDTVFNEGGGDIDFRVESDGSTHMLYIDAGTDTVNINTASPNNGAKLNVYAASGINQVNWGVNGSSQGNPQFARVVRYVTSAGTSLKLVIPFLSQGNLNSTTVCRVMGHNAQFNTNTPKGFDFTFAVGHLSTLANLVVWGTGGNYSSIAINGMNVEVTFSDQYGATGGEPGGLFLTLEYMCNNLLYSIQPNSIVMA